MKVAFLAGERQIFLQVESSVFRCDDVLDIKRKTRVIVFMNTALLTSVRGARLDKGPKTRVHSCTVP